MKTDDEFLKELECNFDSADKLPIIEFYGKPSNFYGTLALICENNHITSYLKNPGNSGFILSDTAQWYKTIIDKYSKFIHYSDPTILELFNYIVSMRQLEFISGASFALRSLIEVLIYDNYGTYAWFGDCTLGSIRDRRKIDKVHYNIKRLGFGTFMPIILSFDYRKKILKCKANENDPDNKCKLTGERLTIAAEAATKLENLSNTERWISDDSLIKIQSIYEYISPFVHSRSTIVESPQIDECVESVLKSYEELYENNKKWGVEYE